MSRLLLTAVAVSAALGLGACSDHEFHPPSEEERVAEAQDRYDDVDFDTITWASTAARLEAGNLVYADECRRCHGPLGRGGTDYAVSNDLEVPSLVVPDWELADDLDGVRERVFVGHQGGMPNWGVGKLTVRQIDASAFYILEALRPEILEGEVPPILDEEERPGS